MLLILKSSLYPVLVIHKSEYGYQHGCCGLEHPDHVLGARYHVRCSPNIFEEGARRFLWHL